MKGRRDGEGGWSAPGLLARSATLSDVTAWLEQYRQMWSDSRDALERHLDQRA